MNSLPPFTSVTRWLLVVIGCAVLAMAQPMSAADESSTPPPAATATAHPSPAATLETAPAASVSSAPAPATASATTATPAPAAKSDLIIYPKAAANSSSSAAVNGKAGETSHAYVVMVAFLLAGAGAWVLIQRRKGAPIVARGSRKLNVEETRPLGNRQYLVVANYEGRKFLLGVTTGQIQLLANLDGDAEAKSS
jgi:flagellar protein FliO/FliZ